LINAAGPDLDRSAAGRVALDAFTVPTSWLTRSITWHAGADPDTAVAEWCLGGYTLRPEIRVGADGTLRSVTVPRWASPHGEPWGEYACGGILEGEASFGGITMPTRMRAGYFLGTERWGEGEFFRATITDLISCRAWLAQRFERTKVTSALTGGIASRLVTFAWW